MLELSRGVLIICVHGCRPEEAGHGRKTCSTDVMLGCFTMVHWPALRTKSQQIRVPVASLSSFNSCDPKHQETSLRLNFFICETETIACISFLSQCLKDYMVMYVIGL